MSNDLGVCALTRIICVIVFAGGNKINSLLLFACAIWVIMLLPSILVRKHIHPHESGYSLDSFRVIAIAF